ncbi:MAG TPA: LacI family DNA-binding transcriptional regulator [bacterium]|nr:LacI family DNA-binding transcriptional regulator [bacterium]
MKNVTIQDIAERAGVTKATVSMVINQDHRITEKTRDKVLKVIKEMHYYPNPSARKLARGKSDVIAFVSARFAAPFIATVMDAFEQRAFQMGRYVHGIHPYSTQHQTEVKEELLQQILYGRTADAVVLVTIRPSEKIVAEYAERKIPLVLLENTLPGSHSIRVDNVRGGFLATEYLLRQGRKRIGLINGITQPPPGVDLVPSAMERLQGYREALETHGIKFDESRVVSYGDYLFEQGRLGLRVLLEKDPRLDAVFCAAGDIVAMGVLAEAQARGLKVPEDLALVGYDDMLASSLLKPALTTVRQPILQMGVSAFETAIEAIDGKLKEDKNIIIQPELIIRESA